MLSDYADDNRMGCEPDTWSCMQLTSESESVEFLQPGCNFPAKSPLALRLSGKTLPSNEAIKVALQMQCMHPPGTYVAHSVPDRLFGATKLHRVERMMASLGPDAADHYICGAPEIQRQSFDLKPMSRHTLAAANFAYAPQPHQQSTEKRHDVLDSPFYWMDRMDAVSCQDHGIDSPRKFLTAINADTRDGLRFRATCNSNAFYAGGGMKEHIVGQEPGRPADPQFLVAHTCNCEGTSKDNCGCGDGRGPSSVNSFDNGIEFLDRYPVMCNDGWLLNTFHWETQWFEGEEHWGNSNINRWWKWADAHGRYRYTCTSPSEAYSKGSEYVKRSPSVRALTQVQTKAMISAMNMKCDHPSHAIRGFRFVTIEGQTFLDKKQLYEYTCIRPDGAPATPAQNSNDPNEYDEAKLAYSNVTVLKHIGEQGEQQTILNWVDTCGETFFAPSKADYDWDSLLQHEKAVDLLKYALAGANEHLKAKQDALIQALKGGGNATVEFNAFSTVAASMKRTLEGLQAALLRKATVAASPEARLWTVAAQTVALNIQQLEPLKQHLQRAHSCMSDDDSIGCASLHIPSFSYKVYGNELSMYLDGNNPKSLRNMASEIEARGQAAQLKQGLERLMDNDVTESVAQATDLKLQLKRLEKEVELSASQIATSHQRMKKATTQMEETMEKLKAAFETWQINQIISTVFELVTSIGMIVASGGMGSVSVIGKLEKMEGEIAGAKKVAEVTEQAAKMGEKGKKYLEQFNKVQKLTKSVNVLANFYKRLPAALQAVMMGIKAGIGCWCAVGERKFKPECVAYKQVSKPPSACMLAFQIQKISKGISEEEFPDVDKMVDRPGVNVLQQSSEEIDAFSAQIAPLMGSYWDDQVADQVATVALYLTGEIGGAYTAEQAQMYIKRTETYASAGKDMIDAASRFVAAHRDMQLIEAQLEANKNIQALKERNREKQQLDGEVDSFLQMATAFKMTTTASMMYSTMRELCDALAYQNAPTYFKCMDETYAAEIDDAKNDVRRFCGAFDPRYKHFQGFQAMPFSPFETKQQVSGKQAAEYLRTWFNTFRQFDSVKRTLQVAHSGQSAGVSRWVTTRIKVIDAPNTTALGHETVHKQQLQSLRKVQDRMRNVHKCRSASDEGPCYATTGSCMTASGEPVDMEDINKKLERAGLEPQACLRFEETTCANCEKAANAHSLKERALGVSVDRQQWDAFASNPLANPLRFHVDPATFGDRQQMLDLDNIFVHDYQVYGEGLVDAQHPSASYQLRVAPGASQEIAFQASTWDAAVGHHKETTITKVFVPKTGAERSGTLETMERFLHFAVLDGEGPNPRCAAEDAQPSPVWGGAAGVCLSADPTIRNSPLCPTSPSWCTHESEHGHANQGGVLASPSLFTQWDLFVDRTQLDGQARELTPCSGSADDGVMCSNLYLRIKYSAERRSSCDGDDCLPQCGFGDATQPV